MRFPLTISTLITALATFIVDQLTKAWLLDIVSAPGQPPLEITSFFNLVMVWNPGVSFGLFAGLDARWPLIALAIGLSIALLWWDRSHTTRWQHIATGLIVGGALGNVMDRLRFGAVADFFDVHVAGYHWPAFNIADSGIVIGVGMLLLAELRRKS